MSKKDRVSENPPEPKHFGERLPDLKAEKQKKLPTGAARRIALKSAKEVGGLVWECVKQGGLPPVGRLLGLAWRAIGIYRESKAEALAELRDTFLTGRNLWATGILTGVETSGFDVSKDASAKQDIRDFLGTGTASQGEAPAAVLGKDPEQARLQAVIDALAKQEEDVKLLVKRLELKPPQGDAKAELDELAGLLTRGKTDLTAHAAALPDERGRVVELADPDDDDPPFTPGQELREQGYLNQYLDITGRALEAARSLPSGTPVKIRGRTVTYFAPKSATKPDYRLDNDDWRDPKYNETLRIATRAGNTLQITRIGSGYLDLTVNGERVDMIHGTDKGDRNELSWNREMFAVALGLAEKGHGKPSDFETTFKGYREKRVGELQSSGPLYFY